VSVFLDTADAENLWYFETPGEPVEYGDDPAEHWQDIDRHVRKHDGELDRVGIDDRELTIDEAMEITHQYGGGEFDNETAGIVAALCTIRDAYSALGGES
jgi:hypothetical protein